MPKKKEKLKAFQVANAAQETNAVKGTKAAEIPDATDIGKLAPPNSLAKPDTHQAMLDGSRSILGPTKVQQKRIKMVTKAQVAW
ncbi:hypothetical protein PpBr36_00236, partial [Pyricularia pennisetigena]|uniref:hypothetical protein n=1 Tax=Pyricularia pennisetigena TaxID=1578925 RepID=UPI00115419F1